MQVYIPVHYLYLLSVNIREKLEPIPADCRQDMGYSPGSLPIYSKANLHAFVLSEETRSLIGNLGMVQGEHAISTQKSHSWQPGLKQNLLIIKKRNVNLLFWSESKYPHLSPSFISFITLSYRFLFLLVKIFTSFILTFLLMLPDVGTLSGKVLPNLLTCVVPLSSLTH